MHKNKKKRIGLALGSGAARGCSHIGVLKELSKMGIEPDIICGTSIGSVVGASYVAGNLKKLEEQFCSFTKMQIVNFFQFDLSFTNFVKKKKLNIFFENYVCGKDQKIEDFSKKFGSVSTLLNSGKEVYFSEGLVFDAISASIAIPGLFSPFNYHGELFVDGGVVNPVPVSLCRKLGADIVIAVDVNAGLVGENKEIPLSNKSILKNISNKIKEYSNGLFFSESIDSSPNFINNILDTINIMQYTITNSRIEKDKPDIILTPNVSHIGLMEFDKAKESIKEGVSSVTRMKSEIKKLVTFADIK